MKNARMALLVGFVITANLFTVYTLASFFVDITVLPEIVLSFIFGGMALSVVLSIACIVFAFVTHKQVAMNVREQRGLKMPVLVFKLVMIPYFVLITLVGLLMVFASSILTLSIHLASMGILFGLASLVMLPIISAINYLYMLATSSFSISAILIEYRKNVISRSMMVVFIILQLLPMADVISYIFIVAYFNRRQQMQQGVTQQGVTQWDMTQRP